MPLAPPRTCLSALIDNHVHNGNPLGIDPRQVLWKRALDMNDRALRNVVVGLGGRSHGVPREEQFQITVASEVMAILCLADGIEDLERSTGRDRDRLHLCRRPRPGA